MLTTKVIQVNPFGGSLFSRARNLLPLLLVALLSLIVTACAPGPAAAQGTYRLSSGRTYYLTGALSKSVPHELFIVLPGLYLGTATTQAQTNFTNYGLLHNDAVVYGINAPGLSGWNAGGCCGTAVNRADDMSYLADVVSSVEKQLPIDRTRVYVVGFSTGAMMAERAACQRPDVFAGAGAVAGDLLVPCPHGAHIVAVHGWTDTTVPLFGGYSPFVNFTFPSVLSERDKILYGHPAAAYTLFAVPNFAHGWPTYANGLDATDRVWNWLQAYHL